jgi:hypothetical protein
MASKVFDEPRASRGLRRRAANRRQHAATKDGKRFLVNVPDRSTPPSPITVALNGPAAIKP